VSIAWAVEEEDAVVSALCAWLSSASAGLGANGTSGQPAIAVLDDWPDATPELALPSVSVTRADAPDVEELDPSLVLDVLGRPLSTLVSGNSYNFIWRVAQATLPLQIDVWASSKPMRGDALARLRPALTASKAATLAAYIAATNAILAGAGLDALPQQDPVDNSIVCQLAAPWDHVLADYAFEHRPELSLSPTAAGADEWRATLRGVATFDITVTAASAKLARVILKAFATTGSSLSGTPKTQLTNTITASGSTITRGP
jgi:hypothetical protein